MAPPRTDARDCRDEMFAHRVCEHGNSGHTENRQARDRNGSKDGGERGLDSNPAEWSKPCAENACTEQGTCQNITRPMHAKIDTREPDDACHEDGYDKN